MSKLEALQCHFTWNLEPSRFQLFHRRDKLEDLGTEEGNSWLGYTHNLQGFIEYKLESLENAQSFFNRATEAFRRVRPASEGPWLAVNYGNLAWLHHLLGDEVASEVYLAKVDALMEEHPSPSQDELHPEIYAEKAWTLMNFGPEKMQLALDYYEKAISMRPDMVQWNTSYVLGLRKYLTYGQTWKEADILREMRVAREKDPENVYLEVCYLEERAKRREPIEEEARELAKKVLRNPTRSYSGINPLLCVYRNYISCDAAIDLAEEALRNHPDVRFLKRCAALCYKKKITWGRNSSPEQSVVSRAIALHRDVISLYPQSSLMRQIDLANICAKSHDGADQAEAEQIFQKLLQKDLEAADKQMLHTQYAKHLFARRDYHGAVKHHMKAAQITLRSVFREESIAFLKNNRDRGNRGQIEEFLQNLQSF